MTASSAPSKEPSVRRESPLPSRWRVLGTLLVTVGFLLFTFSDACGPPPKFEAMEMVGKQKPSYSPGDRVNYKCKQGWEHAYTFTTTTYCELNNSWLPITDWACEKLKCPKLPTIPHCREHLVNGTIAWGHQVHFVCDEGYYLVGRKFILCQLKGARTFWSHAVPRCEKILCSPPPKIKDGKYTFSDVDIFEYAESVTYSCDPSHGEDEFSLVGEKSLYCVANGVWSSSPPECRVVKCLYPELKNGRQITGFRKKYYYQATVMFECNLGYHVRGSDTVVCNSNSTWEPPIPTCVKGPRPTHPTKPPVYNYPGRVTERLKQSERGLPSTGSLLRWQQQLELGRSKASFNRCLHMCVCGILQVFYIKDRVICEQRIS
ncbi:membrane cofactor protein isoform X3 [Lepus europaeus]|uniref:membrane cofactor protein isoform X3 n=1 Tax=Lepus europaeus TaxID=9983 RepID=UPI002B484037|nr:membrane cofactor protein isoform X3 [Lepus europaeus]